jgi:hypothetical protein
MTEQSNTTQESPSQPQRKSKSAAVQKLLSRSRGATLAEIMAATDWLPHSARAFVSVLRRNGRTIAKLDRRNGDTAYHLSV